MSKETLSKTKYPNIYKSNKNNHYLRKRINGKDIKRLIGKNLTDKQAQLNSIIVLENINSTKIIKRKLKDYIEEYLELNKNLYSETWEYSNKYNFSHLESLYDIDLNLVTTEELQRIINVMLNIYSPETCNKVKVSLSALYNYYKLDNKSSEIVIPKYDNQVNFSLPQDKIDLLINTIKEYPNLQLRCFFLMGVSGRRKGEVSRLRWENIDLENCVVHIEPTSSKNRKHMTYPILPELRDNLFQLYMESNYPDKSEYVFLSSKGTRLYWIQKPWKRLCDSIGIEMRYHDLRHLIGYIAINKWISLEHIGATLGHSNLSTTRRYSKLKEDTAREVLTNLYG